jgi:hypothetical protein
MICRRMSTVCRREQASQLCLVCSTFACETRLRADSGTIADHMTHEQGVNIVISLVVGLILIVVGAVLQPLLKRLWERVKTPSPLTPQTRGQLMGQLLVWEAELERLN